MQKTAQKRSILNKLKEMSNVSGIAAEKFFNPEFERVMNSLRATDDKIRAIASGKTIEDQDPGDPVSLKDLIKDAKSNLNRREYMTAIASLGRFHKKLYDISQSIDALNVDVDQVHHDFLFKDLDDEQKKHLSEIKSRFAIARGHSLISQAGIMDFLHNISSERGRALAAWEKRYPKQVSKLKKDTANLISKSESILSIILSTLKEMASARASRKVDDYVKFGEKLTSLYNNYDKSFRDHYVSNVKGFLEKQELLSPNKKIDNTDMGKQEITPNSSEVPDLEVSEENEAIPLVNTKSPNTVPAPAPDFSLEEAYENVTQPNSSAFAPPKLPSGMSVPNQVVVPPAQEDAHEDTLEEEIPPVKSAHQKFITSLETMSNEKPELLASKIRVYAKSIQESDLATSIELLKLAKLIKE